MKIGIIVGTRPEVIKMAPIIRECEKRNYSYFIIHSNQHYSEDMDNIFFKELHLPEPHYNLGVGSGLHSNQTGNILIKMEPILVDEKPDVVLVQGDTNTVLAGALAASKLDIKVGHIEAGLRSYDKTMPEETNRILTDHMSEYLFAVGPNQQSILLKEGIDRTKIATVGNTVSDSLFQHLKISEETSTITDDVGVQANNYFLVTAHRASNVDNETSLNELITLFSKLHEKFDKPFVWPIHPRTKAKLEEFDIAIPSYLKLLPPIGYLDFIQLQKKASLILTDSGGIQEEACLLKVPCITLRENTERPESIEVGANVLVGRDSDKAIAAADKWLQAKEYDWSNPFGNGHVAEAILDIVFNDISSPYEKPIIAKNETIAVIGMGYMGLPIASLLAQVGYSVTGVDLDRNKVDTINKGISPFEEVGLEELVQKVVGQKYLTASMTLPSADTYLIAVPTPHINKKCDSTYLNKALASIAEVAKNGQTVIIESTISPRTSIGAEKFFESRGLKVDVVHCPERAIPGSTLHELVHNDRIIGANNKFAQSKAETIYKSFVEGEVFLTDLTTAECIKLVENTSRDVGIAFANELAEVCEELSVDAYEVIRLANRHPRVNILNPGPGVGGHCIPIDPWFLVEQTSSGELIRLSRKINDNRPVDLANDIAKLVKENDGKSVGVMGVAFKPNIDDCRETPASAFVSTLQKSGISVFYHDPFVPKWEVEREDTIEGLISNTDIQVIITGHDCYKSLVPSTTLIDFSGVSKAK